MTFEKRARDLAVTVASDMRRATVDRLYLAVLELARAYAERAIIEFQKAPRGTFEERLQVALRAAWGRAP